jgi:DnaJ family protein C protein 27
MDRDWIPPPKSASKAKVGALPDILRIKIISLGATCVGKSCLIKRYCEDRVTLLLINRLKFFQFVSKYLSTIGVDYGVKQVTVNSTEVKVNFWDFAGHAEFLEVRNEFYKDTQGVRLMVNLLLTVCPDPACL